MEKALQFKIESFGAVDGPGIRLVIFLQGCSLRCIYCHNPESQSFTNKDAKQITTKEVIDLYEKHKTFYENGGGITLSGGEPLIHLDFCLELAKICYEKKINLALDTSGATFNKLNERKYLEIAKYHPLWIVDIKHINPKKHEMISKSKQQNEIKLIEFLEKNKQKYWVRQVYLPNYTDDKKDLENLGKFLKNKKYMSRFELLPYHEFGLEKYEALGRKYPLKNKTHVPTKEELKSAMQIINKYMK